MHSQKIYQSRSNLWVNSIYKSKEIANKSNTMSNFGHTFVRGVTLGSWNVKIRYIEIFSLTNSETTTYFDNHKSTLTYLEIYFC